MTDKPLKNPFRDPTMTAQNPNASAIPTRTVGPKVHSFQLSVFPREGFCASKECMGAVPRKFVEIVEECLSVLEPAFQNPQLYVNCERGHDPWAAHPLCRHPRCVEAATKVADVLGVMTPLGVDDVPCLKPHLTLDPTQDDPTQDEAPETLTNELLHRLLAAAQLEGLPNLVDLFQEGLKDGSIKPTAPYTNKS